MNDGNNFDVEFKNFANTLIKEAGKTERDNLITPGMCLEAAKLIADCPPDRKYAVMFVLTVGGFDVHDIMTNEKAARSKQSLSNIGRMIEEARDVYNMSIRELSRRSGVQTRLFYFYMHGELKPREVTARKIARTIKELAPEMDTEKYIVL